MPPLYAGGVRDGDGPRAHRDANGSGKRDFHCDVCADRYADCDIYSDTHAHADEHTAAHGD